MYKNSQQIAQEFAQIVSTPSLRSQYVEKASQEVAVPATPKKLSVNIKRALMKVTLVVTIVSVGAFAVNTVVPSYDGTTEEVSIVWGTDISTIEDAVRAVNPTATDKHVADAVKEFVRINNVNEHNIKAGTYKVPVIK